MGNKNEDNENKIILETLIVLWIKLDRDSGNKTQRFYRCRSNYTLSKITVDNGFNDLWRRDNPDFWVHPLWKILWYKIQDRQGLYWYKNC